MAIKSKIILLIFLSWFLSPVFFAQESLKETSIDSGPLEYTLPEIIVKGDNSMRSLRMEVIHAQELKFEVFNNLNSTDDFDITCEWHAPLGTRIKEWSCDVNYMKKARADAVRDWMHGAPIPSDHQLSVQYADKTRALNREMKALAIKHPELAIAMVNAYELQQLFKAERKERYKDSLLIGHSETDENKLAVNKIDLWELAFLDHRRRSISDEIWARWDNMYRKLFQIETYKKLWESVNHDKYNNEFIAYVNEIISDR